MKREERENLRNELKNKYGIAAGTTEEDIFDSSVDRYTMGNPDAIRVFYGIETVKDREQAIVKDFEEQKRRFAEHLAWMQCTEEDYFKAGNRWSRIYYS